MDVKDRLSEVFSDNSLSLQHVSDITGTNYRTLQRYVSGERDPSAEFLAALSDRLDISATWLLTGAGDRSVAASAGLNGRSGDNDHNDASNGDTSFVAIPRFDIEASAGYGSLVEAEMGTGYYAYNRSFLDRRGLNENHLSVIGVSGESMEPELYDKDLVLIATDQTDPRNGFMFAVYFDGHLYVKRVQRLPGNRLHLISTNERYPPIIVDLETSSDVRIVGRVVASMHEW